MGRALNKRSAHPVGLLPFDKVMDWLTRMMVLISRYYHPFIIFNLWIQRVKVNSIFSCLNIRSRFILVMRRGCSTWSIPFMKRRKVFVSLKYSVVLPKVILLITRRRRWDWATSGRTRSRSSWDSWIGRNKSINNKLKRE